MKPSQVVGVSSGNKKCSDSESGWTMYIGSRIFNEEEEDDSEKINKKKPTSSDGNNGNDSDDDDESDDSMASDASSGPIELIITTPNVSKVKESEVFGGLNLKNSTVNKKPCKQVKKIRDETKVRRSEKSYEHEESITKADSAESQV